MLCQLCGYEFNTTNMACHTECPMGSRCNLICCPNCGYQVVDQSKSFLARLLHRLWPSSGIVKNPHHWRGPKHARRNTVPLTHIPIGREVEIDSFEDMPAARLTRLSLFGLTAGSLIEVLQRYPSPVIRIDQTELAMAEEIMEQIWVHP